LQSNDNIVEVSDRIRGFTEKLTVWHKTVNNNVYEMFSSFHNYINDNKLDFTEYKGLLLNHLKNLKIYFEKYFKEILTDNSFELIRNPFLAVTETQLLSLDLKDELIELKCNEYYKLKFKNQKLSSF